MRIFIISDDDSLLPGLTPGGHDVLISCGDISDSSILRAASLAGCRRIFAVKGNHDMPTPFPPPIIDLHMRIESFGGLSFGGFNGCLRYKPRGHYLYAQEEVEALLRDFPPVDVFIAHNSPLGIHDSDDGIHEGFSAFPEYIRRTRPGLFIHGHQHMNTETITGTTKVIAVCGCGRTIEV